MTTNTTDETTKTLKTALDNDNCIRLSQILAAFHAPINEEQAWALAHQTMRCFLLYCECCDTDVVTDGQQQQQQQQQQHIDKCLCLSDSSDLVIHKDGFVHKNTLICRDINIGQSVSVCSDSSPHSSSQETKRPLVQTQRQLLQSFGVVLFHALDYGLQSDEERALSRPLELLIETLTSETDKRRRRSRRRKRCGGRCEQMVDHSLSSEEDADNNDRDEGIDSECEAIEEEPDSCHALTFDAVLHICVSRLNSSSSSSCSARDLADNHYRNVCRALVAETLELCTFLDQISCATQRRNSCSAAATTSSGSDSSSQIAPQLDSLQFHDWARLWIQVIRELRNGVKLKKVNPHHRCHDNHFEVEFELTPYEMLLDDIRSRRYKLNKVMLANGDLPPRVKKDAHALILDFIRSRPPLNSAANRVLRPKPTPSQTLYEKLMQSIRQKEAHHKLRPTGGGGGDASRSLTSTPTRTVTNSGGDSRAALDQPFLRSMNDVHSSSVARGSARRLIKADLTLRLFSSSFEDDDTDVEDKHEDNEELRVEQNLNDSEVFINEKNETNNETNNETIQEKKRKFSFRNLSLNRLLSHERRHSIGICESTEDDIHSQLDVNEDTRQHIESIWESHDWGRALECLSLTLQEVQHIRSVLTKAEIESLAVTKALRDDLENGKICFTCLKTRFSFWGNWSVVCKLCERAICDRCSTKMHIPNEHFDKVPIYMLSPTPSPPALDSHHSWPPEPQPQPHAGHKSRSSPLTKVFPSLLHRRPPPPDVLVMDSSHRKLGPLVRVCKDCKILVRHLIDFGHTNFSSNQKSTTQQSTTH